MTVRVPETVVVAARLNLQPRNAGSAPDREGISFTYLDEVRAIACTVENYTALRLSNGGARQHHDVVSG